MASETEVLIFLSDFKAKLNVWGIVFRDDREKNMQTLLDLDIKPRQREEVLKKLELQNYCDGPLDDNMYNGAKMWIFGVIIKSEEIYIKVTLGRPGSNVICISFHTAEHSMIYPFKR